jgi:hypothetical protein
MARSGSLNVGCWILDVGCFSGLKGKAIALIAGLLAAVNVASAQVQPNVTVDSEPKVVSSSSGQFYVSTRSPLSPNTIDLAAQSDLLTLEPALLAVSCDRIKAELLRQLNMADHWRGKIFIRLHPARSEDEPISVASERFGGNWQGIVELPDAIDRNRLVEAVVRATLLEIANRNATTRPTEIPEWLARGLARQLMGSSELKLILPPPKKQKDGWYISRTTMDFSDDPRPSAYPTRKLNPLTDASPVLRTNEPLTFEQLGWPTDEQLAETGAGLYSSSAQLFVSQLLQEKGGPECLRNLLADLPNYLNWQLAFEQAFQPMFKTTLDVEKWWALQIAQFSGRNLLHLLTREESADQLDAVFQFPIHVQIGRTPPMRTDISLQTIIRGWSRTQQLEMLKSKIWELGVLRLRISPDYVGLVDQYLDVMQEYYKKRRSSTRILAAVGLVSDKSAEEAVDQLDRLDLVRAKMRPEPSAPVISAADSVTP